MAAATAAAANLGQLQQFAAVAAAVSRYRSDFQEMNRLGQGGFGVVVAAVNRQVATGLASGSSCVACPAALLGSTAAAHCAACLFAEASIGLGLRAAGLMGASML